MSDGSDSLQEPKIFRIRKGVVARGVGRRKAKNHDFLFIRWYLFWRRLAGPSLNALLATRRVPPFVAVCFFCLVFIGPGWHVTRQAALRFCLGFCEFEVAMPRGMVAA